MTPLVTEGPQLTVVDAAEQVWRVGFKPEPWAWSGWEWAGADGRFHGRWDDRQGNFRTIYAGSTLLACLLEVLAGSGAFRAGHQSAPSRPRAPGPIERGVKAARHCVESPG